MCKFLRKLFGKKKPKKQDQDGVLLLESGDALLTENSDKVLLG